MSTVGELACSYAVLILKDEGISITVLSVVKKRSGLKKISFVAHSLGGLVARYTIGKLYVQPGEDKSLENESGAKEGGEIAGLEPMNFITFATPHLGSRGHRQVEYVQEKCFFSDSLWPSVSRKNSISNRPLSCWEDRETFVSHSTIQVKTYWLHSDGKDVVFHMMDHFCL